ncbi:UDP binding domain-containing protein [Actinocorallia longicatena]|uniref:Nucleotide sugar dehydrogenase n=1 Tax=Actinocorallia longicatena TaxID=111803 RepID=A0ABP6QB51_9ACTN
MTVEIGLRAALLAGRTRLSVWGGGYIGLSTAINYASHGVRCRVHDIDPARVEEIRAGRSGLPLFEEWIGIPLAPLVRAGLIEATTETVEESRAVHVLAVPTERDGAPWAEPLDTVAAHVMRTDPALCVIESTATPGTCDALADVHPGIPLVVAPRRDWFLGEARRTRELPRVHAALREDLSDAAEDVLSIVSDHLLRASSCGVAELTKCLENGLHHMAALYATQIARAFPGHDVNEAFALASSHWRVQNTYFASAGTGGHCLPVATRHLLEAGDATVLTLLAEGWKFEADQRDYVAALLSGEASGAVGILGLSYRADIPTTTLSPFLDVADRIAGLGRAVLVHDPYCGESIAQDHPALGQGDFHEILRSCGRIFLGAPHRLYRSLTAEDVVMFMRPGQVVLDNEGGWSHLRAAFESAGVLYRRIGDAGWSEPVPTSLSWSPFHDGR